MTPIPTIRLYSPRNLDLRELLVLNSEHLWLKHLWRLYHIITIIYRARWNKTIDNKLAYIPLKNEYLRNVIGSHLADKAIKVLLRLNVIETDGHYIVGYKSIGYRFTPLYAEESFKEVVLEKYEEIPWRAKFKCYAVTTDDFRHKFLFNNLKRVTLDEGVTAKLYDIPYESIFEEDYCFRSVEFIRKRDWNFGYDERTGRVFNNITNFPSVLRPYILIDGKPIVEIDVANCQPLLLLTLYADEPERQTFQDAVQGGTFYEGLNEKLEKPYPIEMRKELKEAVFTSIFFGKVYPKPAKIALAFETLFPVMSQKIIAVKRGDYRNLAVLLQRAEADLIIGKVVGLIARYSQIPVLTVHDSVITLPEHSEYIITLIENVFFERFGFVPTLKIKNYAKIGRESLTETAANEEIGLAA